MNSTAIEPQTESTLSEDLSISQMFALSADFKLEAESAKGESTDESKELTELRKKLPPTTSWNSVQSEVVGSLADTLHSSLLETLGQGWKRYKELLEDAHRSRKSPGESILSTLAEHSIESSLHPYVEIFIGPKSINKIPFEVTLTTEIRGLQLGLRNGAITSVEMGECQWSGKIATGELTLIERHLAPLRIPGRIQLKKAIPLVHD